MNDEPQEQQPTPVFPQYQPPGLNMPDPRQAKPLMKMLARRLMPHPKPRVPPVKKPVARRRKHDTKFY